jgi:hypothetical protein
MPRFFLAALLCAAPLTAAYAQHDHHDGHDMQMGSMTMPTTGVPTESGQSAFGAITEVVAILEADPKTDWAKVDIDTLRDHLVDMDNVTLHAHVASSPVANGMRFDVTGDEAVRDSIRRMVKSHASMTTEDGGQHVTVTEIPAGASMTVIANDAAGGTRIRALGFFGAMTGGVHHQLHHLMMAKGEMHH